MHYSLAVHHNISQLSTHTSTVTWFRPLGWKKDACTFIKIQNLSTNKGHSKLSIRKTSKEPHMLQCAIYNKVNN